jgi:hypothetical protein
MKWRVMVELTGSDGVVRSQEVSAGGSNASECSAAAVGLTLADGKWTLAGLQDHLVQAQVDEYCRQRRGSFGPVDPVKYAEAFGATGFMIRNPAEIASVLKRAMGVEGPVIIGVHVDYSDNPKLFESVDQNSIQ